MDQKITISDPAFRVSRQVALACQDADILNQYFTSVLFTGDGLAERFAGHLPGSISRRVMQELSKRTMPELHEENVRLIPRHELAGRAYIAMRKRLPGIDAPEFKLTEAYRDRFDRDVAKRLNGSESLVYVNEGSGLETLRRAKKHSSITVLEGTQHPQALKEILSAEFDEWSVPSTYRTQPRQKVFDEIETADFVFTQSEFTRSTFLREGVHPSRVHAIPLGVDLSLFAPPALDGDIAESSTLRLLFVGRIGVRKGFGRLLEALLRLSLPNVHLDCYGVMEESFIPIWERLEPLVSRFVTLHPPVSRPELAQKYREADALVLPTLLDSFGQVVLEAMAVGTPVIVTSSCGAPVRDEMDGMVIPPADTEAISIAIQRIYDDREILRFWGKNAAEHASMYSWLRFRSNMAEWLADLMRSRSGQD